MRSASQLQVDKADEKQAGKRKVLKTLSSFNTPPISKIHMMGQTTTIMMDNKVELGSKPGEIDTHSEVKPARLSKKPTR